MAIFTSPPVRLMVTDAVPVSGWMPSGAVAGLAGSAAAGYEQVAPEPDAEAPTGAAAGEEAEGSAVDAPAQADRNRIGTTADSARALARTARRRRNGDPSGRCSAGECEANAA